jgi:two-component system chemotaxis response regulator CheB
MTSTPSGSRVRAIVIGASAGAIDALTAILPKLPADFPLPVMIVVHIPADRPSIIADLFRARCAVAVREAEDKEPIQGGTVYFAPPDYHLLVDTTVAGGEPGSEVLSLSSEEPVLYSRPAIDVLFETAAEVYGAEVMGVVLTGANNDGAAGSRRICAAGGQVVVQRPDQALASTMPTAALEACPQAATLTLAEIANRLLEVGMRR